MTKIIKIMKKSVCLSQDLNLGSQIYLYGLIQPIRGRNRVKYFYFRELHVLHIQKFSNSYRNKYDQSNSRIFESYFWWVFAIWSNCVAVCASVSCSRPWLGLGLLGPIRMKSYRVFKLYTCTKKHR